MKSVQEVRESCAQYLERLEDQLMAGQFPPFPSLRERAAWLRAETCAETGHTRSHPMFNQVEGPPQCSYCGDPLRWPAAVDKLSIGA